MRRGVLWPLADAFRAATAALQVLGVIELVFSIIFTIEMFLRIIALEGIMP